MQAYQNALVYGEDFQFHHGGFAVDDGRFVPLSAASGGEDLHGAYVIPGLIDLHIHGSAGADCSDGDTAGLSRMAESLARSGVTSFVATGMTLPEAQLLKAASAVDAYCRAPSPYGSRLLGFRLEGPFLSKAKCGAQNQNYLASPDLSMLSRVNAASGGRVRIVDVAPELPNAIEFIRAASKTLLVSLAHTAADYDTALLGFQSGAKQITHLWNGMPDLLHRAPSLMGAGLDSPGVMAELIADGVHSHPAMVRAAHRLFGVERLILISDALRCAGMPIGTYQLGGQTVVTDGRTARLIDHPETLAGSAQSLFSLLKSAVSFGIPLEDAVRMATANPAKTLGLSDSLGSIAEGKKADFLLLGRDLALQRVHLGGSCVFSAD